MTGADYANDLVVLENTSAQAEPQVHSQEQAVGGIGLYVYANKIVYVL